MELTAARAAKPLDDELDQLRAMICEMGGLAEVAIREAMHALVYRNNDAAAEIVAADCRIDALETEVERAALNIIALHAPMADDLREVVAALKISGAVERIGDYARNIAKRVPMIEKSRIRPISFLPEMGRMVGEMVQTALDAFARRDARKAEEVCRRDRAVDDFYNSIFRALIAAMTENPDSIATATHLLFVTKNLERIGDHATNIAEMVYFAATGRRMAERQRGADPASGQSPDPADD
jgi:phosphate transport system protein